MKTIIVAAFTISTLIADHDIKAERFADQHRKAMRRVTHIDSAWVEYCKGKGLVPDIVFGCIAEKPQPAATQSVTAPAPAPTK